MGNRLLLADDSITIQKVVAIIFANEEFELTVVDNGNAALEKARELRPDVMLVDALMPGKTGYEVCTEIRRDPNLSSVPILLLVGAFEPLDEDKARDCGADSSISKPFESQQLIDRVKELLELGKSRKAAPAPAPAPAAARPLPIESAAEELWGDLSSFDTMAPAATPAAFTAPAQAAQAAPAAQPAQPAQPAPTAEPSYATFTTPAAPAPQPAAPPVVAPKEPVAAKPPVVQEEIVEASFEDDLWGAFDLEEIPEAAAAAPSGVFGVIEPDAEFEAEEFFSFDDDSEVIEETGPPIDLTYAAQEPVAQPSAEELFSFDEESFAANPEPELEPELELEPEPYEIPDYQAFSFEPEAPAPAPQAAAAPVEPVKEATPVIEPQAAPVFQAAVSGPDQLSARSTAPVFSEADLAAAISRISREVIERIVWEVVPDLAEVLIKEEIKKLKAGSRG